MNDDALRELRELRARAYGPDADLGGDPAAHARIAQLEERVRAAEKARASVEQSEIPVTPPPPTSATPVSEGDGVWDERAPAPPPKAPSSDEQVDRPEQHTTPTLRARIRPTRPVALAWAASLAAAIVVTALVVSGVNGLRAVSAPNGARQVATIGDGERVDDGPANAWFGAEGARSYEFLGLTVLTVDEPGDEAPQTCIAVVPTDSVNFQDRTFSGQVYSGCGVGAFPATAEFTVEAVAPLELRALFPVGTSLQFALVGDEVVVFADDGNGISAADD